MRIKQKILGAPDAEYVKLVQGIVAQVRVYHEPEYCVNITAQKSGRIVAHCYPISKQMYGHYIREAEEINNPKYEDLMDQAMFYQKKANDAKDKRCEAFFAKIAALYAKRASSLSGEQQ